MFDCTTRYSISSLSALLLMAAGSACAAPQDEAGDPSFRSTTIPVNEVADLPRLPTADPCVCETSIPGQCSLRAAIQTANLCPGADDIVLMVSGTYSLSQVLTTDDDDAQGDLDIFESVSISAAVPPLAAAVSATIDGAHWDRIFDIHPEAGLVTLSGIKVMRGKIDPSAYPVGDAHGGCIRVRSSELQMYGVIVGGDGLEGCAGHHGGGLYAEDASVAIHGGIVAHNEAKPWIAGLTTINGLGGAVHALHTDLTIEETQVLSNRASGGGGGVAAISSESFTSFTSVLIDGNDTYLAGGGGYMVAPFSMVDSVVSNNSIIEGDGWGGGLYVGASETGVASVVRGTEVFENTASRGGGLAVEGVLDVVDSAIRDNTASGGNDPSQGGGLWVSKEGLTSLERSSVNNNTADDGAGVFTDAVVRATNSTIANNEANIDGGGLYGGAGSSSKLLHCTIRGNFANSGGGGGAWVDPAGAASLDRSAMFGNTETAGPSQCTGPVDTPTVAVGDPSSCVSPAASVIEGTLNGWGSLVYGGNSTATFAITPPNSALSAAAPCGVAQDQWGQPREEECDIGAYENQSN